MRRSQFTSYEIQMPMEEYRNILLESMREIHRFCEERNLRYWLWGGTLLGAVRHNGFIPWDDDIDITMPREDYERFIREFSSENYGVYSCENNANYPYNFAKAFDKRTRKIEAKYGVDQLNIGVDIDIFPIDQYEKQEDVLKTKLQRRRIMFLRRFSLYSGSRKKTIKSKVADIVATVVRNVFRMTGNRTAKKINKMSLSLRGNGGQYMLYVDSNVKDPLFLNKEWFDNRIPHTFESARFYIPAGYHELLSLIYKDYMTLPPVEMRVAHHRFSAYRIPVDE